MEDDDKPVLYGWVFLPNQKDLAKEWKMPPNYVSAQVGEFRARLPTDTPLDDETIYQPGWKRISSYDVE